MLISLMVPILLDPGLQLTISSGLVGAPTYNLVGASPGAPTYNLVGARRGSNLQSRRGVPRGSNLQSRRGFMLLQSSDSEVAPMSQRL
jgi:hypothetical protein